MSSANRADSSQPKEITKEVCIWQRDELLLVLNCTGSCLSLTDIAMFVDFLEIALPPSKMIRFTSIFSINRQLDQMVISKLVEKKGAYYRIREEGARMADEAELMMEEDEELSRAWDTARKALTNLPSSRLLWDIYLNSVLAQLDARRQT